MQFLWKIFVTSLVFLFIGCGGGGGSSAQTNLTEESTDTIDTTDNIEKNSTEAYKNSILPKISDTVIPEVLIDKKGDGSQKLHKVFNEDKTQSNGFVNLRGRVGYFYFRQTNMNIQLSYLDSIWNQVETYCEGKTVCDIPENNITFTYTEALYTNDIELINLYELKSGDRESFKQLKDVLKKEIGKESFLGRIKLIFLSNSVYDYQLEVDISDITMFEDNLTTVTQWNDEKTVFSLEERLYNGYNGDRGICEDRTRSLIYAGYEYNKTIDNAESSFRYGYDVDCLSTSITSEGDVVEKFQQKHHRFFKLSEQPDKIKLAEHISSEIISEVYTTPLEFYLEGEVTESGGFVIANDTEGFYIHETFDNEGNIINEISCIGDTSRELDDCTVKGEELIKSIILKSFYKVGWFENVPLNVIATHSAVLFNEDNTLDAFINCSIFKADYRLSNKGIVFSNIQEENNDSLQCLDSSYEKNFRLFLEKGYEFNEEGYIVWNGLSAELDVVDEKSKFDKNAFMNNLTANRYVDSYTMNNLFKIHSVALGGFTNLTENRTYFLSQEPTMKIENDKIYFDLIDATFEADVKVVDNDSIKFENIIRVDKTDFTYPVRNCTNEPGPNECIDGDENLQYEDNKFTKVIEDFLNGSVSVSNSGKPDSGSLWFYNETLSFSANYL